MTEISLTRKEEKDLLLKALFGSPFFNILASVLATFIVGAVFFKFGGGVPIQVTSSTTEKLSTFDVTGEGSALGKPDEARVSLEVRVEGVEIAAIQEQANKAMQELGEQLKKLGIEESEIKTTNYSISPNYGERGAGGYAVSATVEVRVEELEQAGQVLDLAGEMGIAQVGELSFAMSTAQVMELKSMARELAIEAAKEKAEELSKLAGMKLSRIVNVQEVEITPIGLEPGSSEVRIQVTLSYETL